MDTQFITVDQAIQDAKGPIESVEIERALLGAAIMEPYLVTTTALEPDQFYLIKHRWIWDELLKADGKGDYITLSDALDKAGHLDDLGGPAYLTQLIGSVPFAPGRQIAEYSAIIKDSASRRAAIELANKIVSKALGDESFDISNEIDNLSNAIAPSGGARHWRYFLDQAHDQWGEAMKNPGATWGISYGDDFPNWDYITGGAHKGQLIVLAGMPGVGKSILAINWAQALAKSAAGVVYSLEMTGLELAGRAASAESRVSTAAIRSGTTTDADTAPIMHGFERLDGLPIYMSDAAEWTSAEIRADLTRLKAQHGIEWVIIDYMQEMSDKAENETEKTGLIGGRLKRIARVLNLHVVVISSVTKLGMDPNIKPTMQLIRGSGQVPHAADTVVWLHPFWANQKNAYHFAMSPEQRAAYATMFILKGRHLANPGQLVHMQKAEYYPRIIEVDQKTIELWKSEEAF